MEHNQIGLNAYNRMWTGKYAIITRQLYEAVARLHTLDYMIELQDRIIHALSGYQDALPITTFQLWSWDESTKALITWFVQFSE